MLTHPERACKEWTPEALEFIGVTDEDGLLRHCFDIKEAEDTTEAITEYVRKLRGDYALHVAHTLHTIV